MPARYVNRFPFKLVKLLFFKMHLYPHRMAVFTASLHSPPSSAAKVPRPTRGISLPLFRRTVSDGGGIFFRLNSNFELGCLGNGIRMAFYMRISLRYLPLPQAHVFSVSSWTCTLQCALCTKPCCENSSRFVLKS